MERLLNFIRGNVRIRIKCIYPERFLNICAESGVEFWDMKREGNELVLTTHYADYRFLRGRERFGSYKITGVKKTGTSFFLWRIRKRYALLIGLVLCLVLCWISSLFVWEITVTGNETVSTAEILAKLEQVGVRIGCNRLTINQDYVSNEMLLLVPELCWLTVNTHGSRAEVKVREEIPVPEIADEDEATVIYAKKAGIIEKMSVLEGKKVVAIGETVNKGDILITGAMDSRSSGVRYVHAMGEVYAKTWYSMSAQLMESVEIKEYTGREKEKYILLFGKDRMKLYFSDISWDRYDKTVKEKRLTVFGVVLPVGIVTETYTEYETVELPLADAEGILKTRLLNSLEEKIDDGEIVWTEFETAKENGIVTVTMTAECIEQIGELRQLEDEEMQGSEEKSEKIADQLS